MVKLLSLGGLVLVVVGLLGCDAGGFDSIEHFSSFGGFGGKNPNYKTPAQVAEWNRRDAELKLQREAQLKLQREVEQERQREAQLKLQREVEQERQREVERERQREAEQQPPSEAPPSEAEQQPQSEAPPSEAEQQPQSEAPQSEAEQQPLGEAEEQTSNEAESQRLINEFMAKLFERLNIPNLLLNIPNSLPEMLRKAAASHQRNLGTVDDATVGFADIPQRLLRDKVQIPEVEA